jgi:leucyl/phenylalanyl-tRNA--protein transferase
VIPSALLIQAYTAGYFPMPVEGDAIGWFSPNPRAILPLDRFHVPKRLERVVRSGRFDVRIDTAFRDVMLGCASRDDEEGNWINAEMIESYTALHRLGRAHSVETWEHERLVGGLYGVSLGGVFFGESMFNAVSDASKVALYALVERLNARGYRLLDIQWLTPFLERFGAMEVPREEYLARLAEGLKLDCRFI